jgi:hypothetical protein
MNTPLLLLPTSPQQLALSGRHVWSVQTTGLAAQQQACKPLNQQKGFRNCSCRLLQKGHTVCIHGSAFKIADPCLLLLLLFAFCIMCRGAPQVVSLHLQQEVGESVTSATSLRTLVAASVMQTVTAKVSMLPTTIITASRA